MTTIKRLQEDIGRTVRDMRNERGWSQEELAHKIGIKDKSGISKIELGGNCTTQTLFRLAKAFKCKLAIQFQE